MYTNLTNNHSGKRKYDITRITPHCFVGSIPVNMMCDYFKRHNNVSANYCIDAKGEIGMSVKEENRAWTSSSADNDHRAITVEIASSTKAPYEMTDESINAFIDLTIDIMKRYNKTKLVCFKDKNEALNYKVKDNELLMTFHYFFKNKSCPGGYFLDKVNDIISKVNSNFIAVNNPNIPMKYQGTFPTLPKRGYFQKGDKGVNVSRVQEFINWAIDAKLSVDSSYGQKTLNAVKNFQKINNLKEDGLFGKQTLVAARNFKK